MLFRFFVIILILQIFLFLPKSIFAHEFAKDKNISVIMHIEPEDNPTPLEESTFHFDVENSNQEFKLANCDCNVIIKEAGRRIFSAKLIGALDKSTSIYNGSIQFVFPKEDTYQIELIGRPISGKAFQPFSLSWNVTVNKTPHIGLFELLLKPVGMFLTFLAGITLLAIVWTKAILKITHGKEQKN